MKVADLAHGYTLHLPTSGGKAGKGHNVTSTLQIRRAGVIEKQIRFVVADRESRKRAYAKVREFVNRQSLPQWVCQHECKHVGCYAERRRLVRIIRCAGTCADGEA